MYTQMTALICSPLPTSTLAAASVVMAGQRNLWRMGTISQPEQNNKLPLLGVLTLS